MPEALFRTRIHQDLAGARIECSGELDISTARLLGAALDEALIDPPATLHVDLAGTTFFSAIGGDLLFDLLARCGASGIRLEVSGSDAVTRVLHLLGFPKDNVSMVTRRHCPTSLRGRPRRRRRAGGIARAAGRHGLS